MDKYKAIGGSKQIVKLEFVGGLCIDSLRRGRVSRPTEFVDAYGAGRETRPLQCRFRWPVESPIGQCVYQSR